jgi:AraC family transcriptional regulator
MNLIEIINDSIEYIEKNLEREITLDELAVRYSVSKHYYYRIFRAFTNHTLNKYIKARKLSEAAKMIMETKCKIIDAALEYGFNAPDVFTKNFKEFFKVSPRYLLKYDIRLNLCEKAKIAERRFKNLNRDIVTAFRIEHLPMVALYGRQIEFDRLNVEELKNAKIFVDDFIHNCMVNRLWDLMLEVTVDFGRYIKYFIGLDKNPETGEKFEIFMIPESDYAVFEYRGDINEIYRTVYLDIKRAIKVSGLKRDSRVLQFFECYKQTYINDRYFTIYVPIM